MAVTIKKLYEETIKVSDSRKHYKQAPKVVFQQTIPYVGTKSLLIQSGVWGMTVKALHQVNLFFSQLETKTTKQSSDDYFHIQYKNEDYWTQKPDLYKTPVRIRCSCPDYRFTFSYYNWKGEAQFGPKPKSYKPKTDRAPRNPGHHIGYCHHVADTISLLRTSGYVKG